MKIIDVRVLTENVPEGDLVKPTVVLRFDEDASGIEKGAISAFARLPGGETVDVSTKNIGIFPGISPTELMLRFERDLKLPPGSALAIEVNPGDGAPPTHGVGLHNPGGAAVSGVGPGDFRDRFARDLLGYPIPTAAADEPPAAAGPADGATLTATVDGQIRKLLGSVPDPGDATTVSATLAEVFVPREVDGVTVFDWTPRSYVAKTQLGAGVTGVQASLADTAATTAEMMRPLVDGLVPLVDIPAADPEEIAASKAIFLDALDEFVREVSIEGGPRVPMAQSLLNRMNLRINDLGGRLSMLTADEEIDRSFVVLASDEEDLTNFIKVRDGVQLLQDLLNRQEGYLKNDLGRLYVFLERALSRLGELSDDLERALDWVYIDQAERDAIELPHLHMSLDQFISWIRDFGQVEAPQLLASSGRRGVTVIRDTLDDPRLDALDTSTISGAIRHFELLLSGDRDNDLPDGLWHPRVTVALSALHRGVDWAYRRAKLAAPRDAEPGKGRTKTAKP